MTTFLYAPIVKGKKNDCIALTRLSPSARSATKPILELTPFDPGGSVDLELEAFVDRVRAVAASGPAFVDLYGPTPGQITASGQLVVLAGFHRLAALGLPLTPVFGFQRDDSMWPALAPIVAQLRQGFCFRVEWEDLDDAAEDTWSAIIERTAQLNLRSSDVDLLLDLGSLLARAPAHVDDVIADFLTLRPVGYRPRAIVVAGSSALNDVTPVPKNGHLAVPRRELRLWARLAAELGKYLPVVYGDYGVVHPTFTTARSGKNANGKIRYTTETAIQYYRGSQLLKPPGFEQFRSLAAKVIASGHYRGPAFSVGDKFIADCAHKRGGTGNLPTWVWVDQNHHFETVADQLCRLVPQIEAVDSADIAESLVTR